LILDSQSQSFTYGWNWSYNSRGELAEAADYLAINDKAYQYDGIGNREKAISGIATDLPFASVNYTANALNQYSLANGVTLPVYSPGPPVILPAYDSDGNFQNGPLPNDQTTSASLEWDGENRLIRITKANGDVIEYGYDFMGRRVKKTTTPFGLSAVVKHFLYDGWNLIAEYNGSTLYRTYTWGLDLSGTMQGAGGVGGLLAVTDEDVTGDPVYFPIYDGNGNITGYIDEGSNQVEIYEYDPFGNLLSGGTTGLDFAHCFSTKYLDQESGFYYYGYRYYDPVTGRWPSRDPIGEAGGRNLYAFLGNNCISRLDYLGHEPVNESDCDKKCYSAGASGDPYAYRRCMKDCILFIHKEECGSYTIRVTHYDKSCKPMKLLKKVCGVEHHYITLSDGTGITFGGAAAGANDWTAKTHKIMVMPGKCSEFNECMKKRQEQGSKELKEGKYRTFTYNCQQVQNWAKACGGLIEALHEL
jgi:RHS repeat-associated protein